MIARNESVLLREAKNRDAQFIYDLVNSPLWLKYIGDRNITNKQDAKLFIKERLQASYSKYGFGLWIIELPNEQQPIGICGFVKRDYLEHPDIGFAMLPEFMGKGLAYKASVLTMELGQTNLGFETIYGITDANNMASQALLEKLGLINIGTVLPPKESEELALFRWTKQT